MFINKKHTAHIISYAYLCHRKNEIRDTNYEFNTNQSEIIHL